MREKTEKQILDEREQIIMDIKSEFPDVEIIDSYCDDDSDLGDIKNKPLAYLAKSLELLATADIAYFAHGWNHTRGCRIEHKCAQDYGIEIRTPASEEEPELLAVEIETVIEYIGVKIVQARPKAKDGKEGYKVIYGNGYESWCPKDVFEKHNRETGAMPFGFALEAVRQGKKIARHGWNGKGMYVVYKPGYMDGIPCNAATAKAHGITEGEKIYCRPYLEIKMVDGQFVPWVPSISDLLVDDWFVVE